MSYNYKKEYAKWKKWKDKEEALLKHYDVPNKKILELREFDKYQFNSNRRFVRNQNTTNIFQQFPVMIRKNLTM